MISGDQWDEAIFSVNKDGAYVGLCFKICPNKICDFFLC
jgi:hypothetical protein